MYVDSSQMPSDARIWIYQSNRALSEQEISAITERAKQFLETWTAHDNALRASFEIRHHHFLIIMIDKNYTQASGCSIDKSVHFIQSLEKEFNITLMDRMLFAYKNNGRVEVVSKKEFSSLLSQGVVNDETTVFNNLVQLKEELNKNWEIALKESWHKSVISH
jgi:chemotaxis regulatin CheY-phosphate phosphatase CheZ